MSNFIKPRASDFVEYLEKCYREKHGYIMGATGQRPKLWAITSWWFTQYNNSKAQKAKALYWREHAPQVHDCNGLLEGFFKAMTGIDINAYARTNYANWCNPKGTGKIPNSRKIPGAAVFIHNGSYISHVGFLWKPVDSKKPDGDWWVIEARGVMYGVVATKLSDRSWNRWGWVTKYLEYADDDVAPSVPKLGGRVFTLGCDGEDVKQLQVILISWGYDLGEWGADGEYGKDTQTAVKEFQEDQGVPVTGNYDEATHNALASLLDAENENDPPETDPVEPPATVFVVRGVIPDLSEYQKELDYDVFCNACDTAIIRARVNGKNDGMLEKHAMNFKKRAFPFSVYDYVTLKSDADAIKQADAFYDRCYSYGPMIYFVDAEKLADGVSHAENRKYVAVYVNRLRQRGARLVCLYTFENMYQKQLKPIRDIFDGVWIASYGKNTGFLSALPTPDEKIILHQHTSMGGAVNKQGVRVPGVPGCKTRIDLNRLTGNKSLSFFTGRKHSGLAYPGAIRVTGDSVNVRSGPGTQYKKLALARKGDLFMLRADSGRGWYAIQYNGSNAFISMDFAKVVEE